MGNGGDASLQTISSVGITKPTVPSHFFGTDSASDNSRHSRIAFYNDLDILTRLLRGSEVTFWL